MKKKKIYVVNFKAICFEKGKERWIETATDVKGGVSRSELIGIFERQKYKLVIGVYLEKKKK